MLKWLKQRFCKHKYRKHYDKATKGVCAALCKVREN